MKNWLIVALCITGMNVHVYAQPCTPLGDQVTPGTNDTWIGYVYDNQNFTNYAGYVNVGTPGNPDFDESFGGDNVNYVTNGCPVLTQTFSVRYLLTKNFTPGYYAITVGGDDGYRLSVDGGSTWLINRWADQSYVTTNELVYISGTQTLVLEYYENSGSNRISFSLALTCMGTEDQTICGTGDIWRGYVYDGTNFNMYKGVVLKGTGAANAYFNETFGGDAVNYATSNCPVYTETFSVRYRLRKTFNNVSALFLVGGDDGYRLSINGGATWVINNWSDHGYTTSNYTAVLNGTYDLVLEYYENGGGNRVSFDVSTTVLPIQLLRFDGEQKNNQVNLSWLINNASSITIERSADGKTYTPIATVNNATKYTDALPLTGTSFYRLKMTDDKGVISYSEIITIKGNTITGLKFYPTVLAPGNNLYLHTNQQIDHGTITVCDLFGRPLLQQPVKKLVSNQIIQVRLNQLLAKGMYLVQVRTGAAVLLTQKLIVE